MSIKLQKLSSDTTIIKNYIKDLSFENLCNVNNQGFTENDLKISDNISAVFQTYNDNNFSVLEIDYFGLFKKNNMSNYSNDNLVKIGCILIFPTLKSIVEYMSNHGAPIKITLTEPDFNSIKA